MEEKKKKQFSFTRTDDLTSYQQAMFDVMQSWGRARFQLLTLLFKTLFTEEELSDPSYVSGKIFTKAQQYQEAGSRLSAVVQKQMTVSSPVAEPESVATDPSPREETQPEEERVSGFDFNDLAMMYSRKD